MSYSSIVISKSPSGYWRLGEASGNAADSSGNSRTATASGTITYSTTGALTRDTNKGNTLGADGKYVIASNSAFDGGTNFTVEFWGSHASTAGTVIGFSRYDGVGNSFWLGLGNTAHKATFSACGGTINSSVSIDDGVKHHIVGRKTGLTLDIFVDGVKVGTGAASNSLPMTGPVWIGDFAAVSLPWASFIDEVAFYPTALSDASILENYTAGLGRVETRVTTGGVDLLVIVPTTYDGTSAIGAVGYHHGAGEDREAWFSDGHKTAIREALLDDGRLLWGITANTGGVNHWGCPAAMAKYAIAHPYVLANYNVSGVVLLPQSMGGTTGFQAARNRTTYQRVKGVYAIYPVCDVINVYDTVAPFQADMLASWGVANRTALVAAVAPYNPVQLSAAGYPGYRYRFHASAADTIVPKAANTDAMRTVLSHRATKENSLVATSGDHGDNSNFDATDASAFVTAALADTSEASNAVESSPPACVFRRR